MGHRTLSVRLIWRALLLDSEAYARLRDDDNPFVEGLFLVALIGVATALLSLVGQTLEWASGPDPNRVKQIVLEGLQSMSWWPLAAADPGFAEAFRRWYDLGWQVLPVLLGAADPLRAAANLLFWPLAMLLGWLIYGLLAHSFARLLRGTGTLNQTLGTTALAAAPLLLRGLEVVPFLAVGGVLNTWQLICRYKALRVAHGLSWGRAFWATLLPFVVYLLFWVATGVTAATILAAAMRR